jgi:3-hydroxyisobutyrate dehydrogenase
MRRDCYGDPIMQKPVIGFVGTGVMGKSMAGHLLAAGHTLHVHNRTRAKADDLVARGATFHADVGELAALSNVVITIVGFPADVEAVYLGPRGLALAARPGTYLIDMTTSSPALAKRIHETAKARDVSAVDAPVSGGDKGAREATLSIMVGADEATFQAVLPVLNLMGKNVVRQGGPGSGQHAKLCNQIAIAGTMMGVCEALAYARGAGLDGATVLESIGSGAAGSWSLTNLAPRIIRGDFEPGFYVKHFIKDMTLALEAAAQMKLDARGLALALELYEEVARAGLGDKGTQALYKRYEQR